MERLTTFVLTKWESKDRNNNKVDIEKEIKKALEDESMGDEEINKLLKTSKLNKLSLTADNRAH